MEKDILPAEPPKKPGLIREFFNFIGQQGVLGLAIGFVFGDAISGLIGSLVRDIIDPILGLLLIKGNELSSASFTIQSTTISWGRFLSAIIDFLVIAVVVFFIVRFSRLKDVRPSISIRR